MNNIELSALPSIATGARWSARALSALILLFWSFFIVAHIVGDEARSSRSLVTSDYISLAAMAISLTGLAAAWKWEIIGGAVTLVAVLIGAFANLKSISFPFSLIPLTAGLFLLSGLMSRARTRG